MNMRLGDFLTRSSIWIALAGYFAGAILFALSRGRTGVDRIARLAWTGGCLFLITHIIFAFKFYHHWDHDVAYTETARQTNDVVGFDWGGGLYINYLISILWLLDAGWWWFRGLEGYRRRHLYITLLWQAVLLFIVFNATVIFASGSIRWIGLILSTLIIMSWIFAGIRRDEPRHRTGTNQ